MAFKFYNPNPYNLLVEDCTIRAVAKLMNLSWDDAYLELSTQGLLMKNVANANSVLGAYLYSKGFRRHVIPDTCPQCYTIDEFTLDNPRGRYLLATGTHVVAVVNGDYYDTWDSGNEVPIYFWEKEEWFR